MKDKIKVLVIDDSALVRDILTRGLSADSEIEVVASASDPYIARDKILKYNPDVLTLDVEMPKMDGVEFLRRLMPQYPIPVVMVSALTQKGKQVTFDALEAGAVDFVTKPTSDIARGLNQMLAELREKVKISARAKVEIKSRTIIEKPQHVQFEKHALSDSTDKVIAIGASTGGTEAIRCVLGQLPVSIPGIVIVQHMPEGFTKMFAQRLNDQCAISVKEAEPGDRIISGRALIAQGNFHLVVNRSGGYYHVDCYYAEKVCGHRPSVEVLFNSVAQHVGPNAIGIMLTGMGHDGADAMAAMRMAGARTLAQDEASSVVFGMPKEAFKRGGAEKLVPLSLIAPTLVNILAEKQ
jgi:two-component system, chemotaxis family, protein-glutamate methylesterase/glutaminase